MEVAITYKQMLYTKNKNVLRLIFGRTTSLFGASMYLIALPLYILEVSGSLAQMGVYFALINLPALLISPFLGVYVERVNRKHLLVLCDTITACIYALMWVCSIYNQLSLPVLAILAIFVQVLASIFSISSNVLFSELNDVDSLERMNGLKSFFDNFANLVAPMLGTFLFALFGFSFIILLVAILFGISAFQELWIVYSYDHNVNVHEKRAILFEIKDGIAYIIKEKDVLQIFVIAMILNFFVANSEEIILPGILIQKYHIKDSFYGLSTTSFVVGTLLAGALIYKNKKIELKKYLPHFLILASLCMIIIGISSYVLYPNKIFYVIFFLFMIVNGCLVTFVNVPIFAFFQAKVPISIQGRFFALLSLSSSFFVPLGITYTGFLAENLGADVATILNNGMVILIVVYIFYFASNKIFKKASVEGMNKGT